MFERVIDLKALVQRKSFFLFGPRQTGKSTELRRCFPGAAFIDLLEADTYRELTARPETLRQSWLSPRQDLLIVDEIQKLPLLLDEIQLLLDRNKALRVILTGSSARKLKRGNANLLGGRAWTCRLHPLVSPEIPNEDLAIRLNRGGLPAIYSSGDYGEELRAYVGTYLQEEIKAEGLTRSIENFSRFLEVAGLTSGEQLNYAAVANDAQVPARTVREHYQILKDTLIGEDLPAYQNTVKRKPVATAKFFLFDLGVANVLKRQSGLQQGSVAYGRALEHLVFLELRAYLDYTRRTDSLSFWRTRTGSFEVNFLVGDDVAIEVKSKRAVSHADLNGLLALGEERKLKRRIVACQEPRPRRTDEGIEILPVEIFLKRLWSNSIF
jgi:predicted AAA+ superfamily ATPase